MDKIDHGHVCYVLLYIYPRKEIFIGFHQDYMIFIYIIVLLNHGGVKYD